MFKRCEYFATLKTVDKVAKPCRAIKRNSIRGPRQIENLVGKRRKERSVYYEFQRNSFKHGISFDVVGQGLAPAESILINYNLKSGLNVVFKPLLALSVFCEWAVHTYSSTHKKRNLSHFLEVSQRVEICNWAFSTR